MALQSSKMWNIVATLAAGKVTRRGSSAGTTLRMVNGAAVTVFAVLCSGQTAGGLGPSFRSRASVREPGIRGGNRSLRHGGEHEPGRRLRLITPATRGNRASDARKSASHYNFRYSAMTTMNTTARNLLNGVVGAPGFEPGASCAQGRRATRLRYAPT